MSPRVDWWKGEHSKGKGWWLKFDAYGARKQLESCDHRYFELVYEEGRLECTGCGARVRPTDLAAVVPAKGKPGPFWKELMKEKAERALKDRKLWIEAKRRDSRPWSRDNLVVEDEGDERNGERK